MTSAVAPLGCHVSPTSASTSSVWSWMLASSVSRTSWPGSVRWASRSSIVSPSASLTSRRSPSRPRRCVVEAVLEAGEPGAVGADVAEQLRRHPVARVLAAVLRDELEPLDVELLRAQRPLGRHAAGEVDEAGVAAHELAQQLVLGPAEDAARAGRRPRRVVDQVRRGRDRLRGLGDRQLDAVRVADRAAAGGDDDVGLLLGGRGGLERVRPHDAEPAGAGAGRARA